MKYFAKVTSTGYTPKNKLQEAAKLLLNTREQILLDESEVIPWKDDLEKRIKALNDYFRRCSPLTFSFDKSHDDNDYIFTCNEVFTITLYEVRNS